MLRLRTLFINAVAVGALSFVATGCGDDGDDPAPGGDGGQQTSAEQPDPLVGEWDSGPVPISKIRAAVVSADADADLNQLLRFISAPGAKSLEFNRQFSPRG